MAERIVWNERALEDVLNSDGVQKELQRHAEGIVDSASGATGTSRMQFRTRRGKGPKGAFAQAIMSGDGALAVEYGSRNNPAYAPLRSALRRRR